MRRILVALSLITLFTNQVFAQTPHTWHKVVANKPATCQLSNAYETNFYFVNSTDDRITSFELDGIRPVAFGFVFEDGVDFNLIYTLTCTRKDGKFSSSPKVTYVVGANGPAQPNIHVVDYYGANGNYTIVPGIGENFAITFP